MVKVIVSRAALTSVNRECSQGSVITSEEAVHPQFGTRTTLFGTQFGTQVHFFNTVWCTIAEFGTQLHIFDQQQEYIKSTSTLLSLIILSFKKPEYADHSSISISGSLSFSALRCNLVDKNWNCTCL